MEHDFIEQLENEGLLGEEAAEKLHQQRAAGIISLRPEIMSLLYLGVLLTSTGVGILIYKNIDLIGHATLLSIIALASGAGYYYCWKHKTEFTWEKTVSVGHFFDYALLLSSLLTVTFFGYLQFQYNVFGDRWDLATVIPMLLLFFLAYYFDHLGVLSLAITHLGAWLGLTITPLKLLQSGNFKSDNIIWTGIALGVLLNLLARLSQWMKLKAHFHFTYLHFGLHLLLISLMAKMFGEKSPYFVWFLVIMAVCYYYYLSALQMKSFYIMLLVSLYSYVAILYGIGRPLTELANSSGAVSLIALLFMGVSIGLIFFLLEMNKKIKSL